VAARTARSSARSADVGERADVGAADVVGTLVSTAATGACERGAVVRPAVGDVVCASIAGCDTPTVTPRLTAIGRSPAMTAAPTTITATPQRGAPDGGGLRVMAGKLRDDLRFRIIASPDQRVRYQQ